MQINNYENCDKYTKICKDIEDINETFHILDEIIKEQGENITNIEDFIVNTKNNVINAEKDLKIASDYNYYSKKLLLLLPISGAFFGFKFFILGGGISYLLYEKYKT